MRTYVLAIAGAVLLSAVVTMISPSGKMGAFVKGAAKLFILVVLVAPFVSWFGKGEASLGSSKISLDGDYLAQCAQMLSEEDEREIEALLSEEFSVAGNAEVTRRADASFSYEKIIVKISDFGIFGQGEHKDITDRVQAFLTERYGCEAEVM